MHKLPLYLREESTRQGEVQTGDRVWGGSTTEQYTELDSNFQHEFPLLGHLGSHNWDTKNITVNSQFKKDLNLKIYMRYYFQMTSF